MKPLDGLAAMTTSWLRSVEKLVFMAHESNIRALGLVSPEPGSGVSSLGRSIAEVSAHAGVATLLLDLSLRALEPMKGGWIPQSGQGMQWTTRDPAGFDILYGDCAPASRLLFNNVAQLRVAISGDLASYGLIVINLPPVADIPDGAINPLAAALACDGVILVGTLGLTLRAKLEQAMDSMRSAGVRLIGLVVFGAPAATERAGGAGNRRGKSARNAQVER